MNVEHLMTKPAVTCRPAESARDAAERMWTHRCGSVVVVGDDETVCAMITDRDVCMAAYTQGKPLHEISVASAMSRGAHTCGLGEPIENAESLMREYRIRRIPIVDRAGHPVGIVSIDDIMRYASSSALTSRADRDAVQTLARISEPPPDEALEHAR